MVEYLTQQQLTDLFEVATAPRDNLLIRVMYETGCTVSEVVQIRREDLRKHHILIQNRSSHVTQELLDKLHQFLKTHDSSYVFTTRQSGAMSEKRVQQLVKKYLKQITHSLQKPCPQILRYTHIAHAVEQRIPFVAMQRQLGLGELRLSQIVHAVSESISDGYGGWMS